MPPGIVEGSLVQSPMAGAQVNPKAFRNAALEKGRVAAGAGNAVSGLFQDVGDKIAQNRQARQVFDADLTMRKTYDDFTAQMVNMPDEGTWLPAWKEQTQKTRDQVLDSPHLSPDTKTLLSMKFDAWEQSTTSATNTAALLKGHTESRNSAIRDATYAVHTGDLDGANNIMSAAVANHAFSPKEAADITRKFPEMAARAKSDAAIAKDPILARGVIEGSSWYKDLTPADQKAYMAAADTAKLKRQGQNYDSMLRDKVDSKTGQIPETIVRQAIDMGQIQARTGENLINAQKRENEKGDEDQYKYVSVLAHDPTAWRTAKPEEYASQLISESAKIKSPTVRQRAMDDIQRQLDAVHKEGFTADKPIVQEQLQTMKANMASDDRAIEVVPGKPKVKGFFWDDDAVSPKYAKSVDELKTMSDDAFETAYGKDVKREDLVKTAEAQVRDRQRRMVYAQNSFLNWAHDPANEKEVANPIKANEMREHFERQASAIPHLDTTKDDFEALPAGATYYWQGQAYTK